MSQTREKLRAAAGGVSTAKAAFFCCVIFPPNRQVRRDISLVEVGQQRAQMQAFQRAFTKFGLEPGLGLLQMR